MADQIEVRGIRALGIIGVCREEQERPQPFEIDFDLETDVSEAGRTDDLADTIDYGALIGVVFRVVEKERHLLLEKVASSARRRPARVRRASARRCGSRSASCGRLSPTTSQRRPSRSGRRR